VSRYRSYGKLDDPFVTEGDTFFLRMNARLRPNQLKPGEVALSKNGRMNDDGTWQPRKGLNTLFGSITTGEDAIRLPYIILSASRSSNVVTVVLDDTPSLSFIVGNNITIDGLNFTGDDPNGTFPLASVNFNTRTITYNSTGTNEVFSTVGSSQRWSTIDTSYTNLNQTWSSLNPEGRTSVASIGNAIPTTINYIVTNAVRASNVVTLTLEDTPASEFAVSGTVHVDDIDASINGSHTITAINTSAKTVSFADTGADTTFTVNSNNVGNTSVASTTENFTLDDDAVNAVFGSAVYSDASSENDDFIFSATNNLCLIVRLKDAKLYKCRYEQGGETVDGPVGMSQGFDKMFIFRTRKTTLSASPKLNRFEIISASQSGQTISVTTASDHGRLVGDFVTLTRLGNWEYNPNDCYQVASVPSSTQLTVTMTQSQTKTFNVSGAQVEYFEDFTRVSSGAYTAPVYLTDTNTESSNGVVTMDVSSHGLSVGDRVVIQNGASPFDTYEGQEVRVTTVPTVNQFTFNLNVDDATGKSVTVTRPLAIGKGFIHQPAAPFGEFHQRRLWVPYQYTSATSPTDRDIRDELVASDIFDSDTFDQIGNQFRISSGKSDFIVGIKGFTQDSVVVFNRKSIHLMTGVSGSLADVKTTMVTDEVGAAARKSIVQVANQIMFLSDQGIYSVSFLDEYNLRGTGTPLSETIQPYIDRINQDFAYLSVGVYFNNRYWLAVPLDSQPGAGDTNKLNTILVYNFINQGFESIDNVNSSDFAIRDLLVAREGSQNALYLTTLEGGVHKLDALEGSDKVSQKAGQRPEDDPGIDVVSQLTTRQYDADSMDRKNFSRAEFQIKSSDSNPSNGDIRFIAEDPDSISEPVNLATLLGNELGTAEDASVRLRVRKRGFGVQADFQPTNGRPYLRSAKVDARIADRSTTSVQ
jgi:hypothetical protein